ncbi:MAG: hypothetical protein MRY83_14230 [Flavobacteriales bacterium]|nr:hypothetical protein [Flavobacteriales bacterium]
MKSAISKYTLKQRLKKAQRKVKAVMLSQVKSCGVIATVNDKNQLEKVQKFKKALEKKGVSKVDILCVSNDKKVLETLNISEDQLLIIKTDTSWLNLPKKLKTQRFINEKFGLLIDVTQKSHPAIDFVIGLSKAGFKVGPKRTDDLEIYDLEIDANADKSFQYLCDQVLHYLEMIKTK